MSSGLVDRHISFLEALRAAGLSVSLAEDLDAIAALQALPWGDRSVVQAGYAATLVKKQTQRPTFDALFDVYFPRMVGDGVAGRRDDDVDQGLTDDDRGPVLSHEAHVTCRRVRPGTAESCCGQPTGI